jgi:hypothetical protein
LDGTDSWHCTHTPYILFLPHTQAIAYKKMALRDAFDQAQAALASQRPLQEEERALTALIRRQAELKERLRQVCVCVCACVWEVNGEARIED